MMTRERMFGNRVLAGVVFGLLVAGAATATEEGWSGDLGVAVTAQSGTQDTFAGSIDARGTRTWAKDVAEIRFNGVYGTSRNRQDSDSDDRVIQNSQGLFGDWKHTFNERAFWQTGSELSRDNTTDRDVRVAISTGPGYRAWMGGDANAEHFDIFAGLGYRFEQYDGNANKPDTNKDIANLADLVAGFEYKNGLFEDRVNYTHTFLGKAPANDFEAYLLRTEVLIGIPLTEAWSFRTGVLVEFVNANPEGTNPLTTRTTVGLGYTF